MKRILRHGLFLAVAGTIIMTGCQSQNEGQTSGSIVAEENGSTGSTETVIIGNGDSVTVTGTGAAVDQRVVTITAAERTGSGGNLPTARLQ